MSNDTVDALLDNLRSKLPGATDDALKLELYNVVDEVAREALRVSAPVNRDDDPANWLAAQYWVPNYQTILHGTLARMYAQIGKPWASPELAKAHAERYGAYLDLSRSEASGSPTTVYQRLLSNLRTTLPMARDAAIRLEIYNVVDKIRREALREDPLGDEEDPAEWLTTDQWTQCYQAVLHGTLSRMYAQIGKAWASPELARSHYELYAVELELVRVEESSATSDELLRLQNNIRINVPTARDDVLNIELFNAAKEFFRTTNAWQEEIEFSTVANQTTYELVPTEGTIIRLLQVLNANDLPVWADMSEPGVLVLRSTPTQVETLTATVALTVVDPVSRDDLPEFPAWLLTKYADEIADGAIGRMMMQPAKPYTNERMAVYHLRRFRDGMARAKVDTQHNNVYRGQAWRFPHFA